MSEIIKLELIKKLPGELKKLVDLAYNLWWSWNPDARTVFKELDPPLWHSTRHNAVAILRQLSSSRIEYILKNTSYINKLNKVYDRFLHLKNNSNNLWFKSAHAEHKDSTIAYLSMEYGIHNSVRIYSGGLGILAGDHLKEASDLGVPIVAVGFLYQEGYFTQKIPLDGWQQALYREADFFDLPITEVKNPDEPDENLLIPINFNNIIVYVKIWKLLVGRITLYLMDSNIQNNTPWDQNLTDRLYGGSQELRMKQEMILGLGAVRLFKKLKITPSMYHLNEGHCSFSAIERIYDLVNDGKSFNDAISEIRQNTIFTTHTPVPAGHDVFPYNLVETYFNEIYISKFGRENFFSLGSYRFEQTGNEGFNMTVLGMRTAKQINSVSKLHHDVTEQMFQPLWEEFKEKYNESHPLTYVTNGVHIPSFMAEHIQDFISLEFPDWRENFDNPNYWQVQLKNIEKISNEQIWQIHAKSKERLFRLIRETARSRIKAEEWGSEMALINGTLFDPKALTIGFARRFATYKRATMIFKIFERIQQLVSNEYQPIQIIFSGKAHPADDAGKKLIQDVVNHAKNNKFGHRIAFFEDYGLVSAKMLLQGVDVWLNNPLRPNEASGTSGMKASCNFVPNLSILDGWWAEGYNEKNGWAINKENKTIEPENQDLFDAESLYNVLEKEIIPLFYDRDENGIPNKFINFMREAFVSVLPNFSSRRMVKDYVNNLYIKSLK
jgi:starch phosphorylase